MKTIAITIDEDALNRIDQLAEQSPQKTNRSKIIREAVREYLSRIERMLEEEREKEIFRKNRKLLARQTAVLVKEQAKP
jgi:metal-responsive CopG/Arc/MetJ family transcriptional regulator